jgi:voltage-gated potassium channel
MTNPGDRRDPRTDAAPQGSAVKRRVPVGRSWDRFMADPSSTRKAIAVIVVAYLLTVLISAFFMWLLDRAEYPDLSVALWWAIQTVTTVGYGDVPPADPVGRAVAAGVMLAAVAFLAIVTASITSAFIESRQSQRRAGAAALDAEHRERLEARLAEISARLEAIERGTGPIS